MAKRGRPSKDGAPRYACGKAKPDTAASPQLLMQRHAAVGNVLPARYAHLAPAQQLKHVVGGNDPALARDVLGILFARRMIMEMDAEAGRRFARLYTRYLATWGKKVHHSAIDLLKISGGELAEENAETVAQTRQRYLDARAEVETCGGLAMQIVENVCVYDKAPYALLSRMAGGTPRAGDEREMTALTDGLHKLAVFFKLADRKVAMRAELIGA